MTDSKNKKSKSKKYDGIAASPGVAIGRAFIFDKANLWIEEENISPDEVEHEKNRLKTAVEDVINDIKALKSKLEQKIGTEEASIFDPHIMLLQDPAVIKETFDLIEKGKSAEFSFFRTTRKIIKAFKRVEDTYIHQRVDDITDILRRVYTKLQGKEFTHYYNIKRPVIIIAQNLTPSDTAYMHTANILAFVTDAGGITSHATILARSLGIPAVVGAKSASTEILPDDLVIVDGGRGKIFVNPDEKTIEDFQKDKENIEKIRQSLMAIKDLPAVTIDEHPVSLHSNIEFPDEVNAVIQNGAEGIGLYRSEFHFLMDNKIPSEQELFNSYFKVAKELAPKPVTIRTFDLGGDKISHLIPYEPEENPFLGWRAIRVSLSRKDIFKIHLRAIVRSSSLRNVKVMFPMISSMDELNEALSVLDEVKEELKQEKYDFDPDMPVGIMIEIPSAVMIADHLAEKVSFFSIGTNDLIQYSVAVDRTNDRIAKLFDPFHPGVLKLIKMTIDAAHSKGIKVAVCGEMSNEPATALLLLGLGIDELSMASSYIPSIKRVIRAVSFENVQKLAHKALDVGTAAEIKGLIHEEMKKINITN